MLLAGTHFLTLGPTLSPNRVGGIEPGFCFSLLVEKKQQSVSVCLLQY